jgi:G3E family GTPase
VIVNEFGAVGLDHELLRSCEERVELIGGGCACCTRRTDLVRVLRELLDGRDRGSIELNRVVIETSGLADPAPIVFTITTDPMLRHHFEVERLMVTVDAANCAAQLSEHSEATKQVMVADELVITKLDLVAAEHGTEVARRLRALNPAASFRAALHGVQEPLQVSEDRFAPIPGERRQLGPAEQPSGDDIGHTADVATLTLRADGPVDWLGFAVWLSMLLHVHGQDVLRVKGLLELDGGTLVSVNGVQHVMHMPEHLPPGAIAEPTPSVVFIVRGMDVERLQGSFETFQQLARDTGGARTP